jgi:MFS family permease
VADHALYFVRKDKFPGWWVVTSSFVVLFVNAGLGFYGLAVYLNAFVRELDFNVTMVSLAVTWFFLVSGLANIFIARLVQRFDIRNLVYIGGVGGGISLILFGQVTNELQMFGAYTLFAVTWGFSGPVPITTIVTRWFLVKRSVALATASIGLSAGGIVLGPITKRLIDDAGLRTGSIWIGVIWLVVTCVPTFLFLRSSPTELGWLPDGERIVDDYVPAIKGMDFHTAIRTRFFWLVTLGFTCALGTQVGAIQQLVKLVEERTSPSTAAFATSVLAGCGVAVRILGARLLPRFNLRKLGIFVCAAMGVSVLGIGYSQSTLLLLMSIGLLGMMVGNTYIIQSLMLVDKFGSKDFARITARCNLISMLGMAGGPLLLGWLRDLSEGYEVPYTVAAIVSFVGAFTLFLISKEDEKSFDADEQLVAS